MRSTWSVVLVAALAFESVPATADPDDNAKWLINDPLTMMDFGLYRMSLALSSEPNPTGGGVSYGWNDNKIIISESVPAGTLESIEANCSIWVAEVRALAGISGETGLPYFGGISRFSSMFAHIGFDRTQAPADLHKAIDRMIEIECGGMSRAEDNAITYMTVRAPLIGKTYSVEKEKGATP